MLLRNPGKVRAWTSAPNPPSSRSEALRFIEPSAVGSTPDFSRVFSRHLGSRHLKGQCHNIQWFFELFFARVKNGDYLRKCRGHQTMTAQSAPRRASPPKTSRAKVVFLEKMSFSAAFPCGRHYFSPHKMAAKYHRISWHCRFKFV